MQRKQIVLLALLGLFAVAVVYLALRNPEAPFMPVDDEHRAFVNADPCLECHGPDGAASQSQNHPVGRDCTRCHGWPK